MSTVWCVFEVHGDERYLMAIYPTKEKALYWCIASRVPLDDLKIEEWEVLDA